MEKWVDPKTGQSSGRIKNPGSLLRAVQALVSRSKVNAVAVVGRFPDDDTDDSDEVDDYRLGMVHTNFSIFGTSMLVLNNPVLSVSDCIIRHK